MFLLIDAGFLSVVNSSKSTMKGSFSGNTLYVGGSGPGNYSSIQNAIDDATTNDIVFVFSGIYQENVIVSKSISLIGENEQTTIIDADNLGSSLKISSNGVNVKNFTLINGIDTRAGLRILNANNILIEHVICHSNNNHGIWIHNSDCWINNCITHNNSNSGIYVYHNEFCGDYYRTRFNNISSNDNGNHGIEVFVDTYYKWNDYYHYFYSDITDSQFLRNQNIGMYLHVYAEGWGYFHSNGFLEATVTNCTSLNNKQGFYSYQNHAWGASIATSEIYISMVNSHFENNTEYGGKFRRTNTLELSNCYFMNSTYGVFLRDANYNSNDYFKNSTIMNNENGLYLTNIENLLIYHNDFINNFNHTNDDDTNHWDNGYPIGGNYYDTFDEPAEGAFDAFSGINQDIPGSDGIVDTSYFIDGGSNIDNYPIIDPLQNPDQVILKEGLVGYWRFNEGNGNIAFDSSDYMNHATIHDAHWFNCTNDGNCLYFDGVNDYVSISDQNEFDLTDNLTMSSWVNIPVNKFSIIINKGESWGYWLNESSYLEASNSNLTAEEILSPNPINIDTWTHVGYTYNGSIVKLFINGLEVNSTPATGSFLTDNYDLHIGANSPTVWEISAFHGYIDEVRIYNRSLSNNEMFTLFNHHDPCNIQTDLEPPVTTIIISEPNTPAEQNKHYITSETNLSFSTTDPGGSGIDYTEYKIWYLGSWSGPFLYNEPFNLSGECVHYVLFRSVDNVGNIEPWQNHTFYVDDTAPTSWVEIGDPHWGNWILPETPITIYADDSGPCSVSNLTPPTIYYSLDGGINWINITLHWNPIIGYFYVNLSFNCSCNLIWYCTDELNQIGFPDFPPTGQYCFTVTDTIETWTILGNNYYTDLEGALHISGETPIEIGGNVHPFNGDTCYYIVYRTWWNVTKTWTPWSIGPCNSSVTLYFNEECMHYLEFYAIDDAGNNESQPNWINLHNITLYVDLTPPTFSINTPRHGYYPIDEISSYLKPDTSIFLTAEDLPDPPCKSGLKRIYWRYKYKGTDYPLPGGGNAIDGNQLGSSYQLTDPKILNHWWYYNLSDSQVEIQFFDECQHDVYFWAMDNVWNNGNITMYSYFVDETPPEITKIDPESYIPINSTKGSIKIYDTIQLTAEDIGTEPCISGVENIFYRYEHLGTSYPQPGETNAIDGIQLSQLYDYNGPEILNYWWYYNVTPASIELSFQSLGDHELFYWAKDNVCNHGTIFSHLYVVNNCQDEVWVDDDFVLSTPGYGVTYFIYKQHALDWLAPNGIAHMYDGIYDEDIIVDDYPCDNTGMTQYGEYGCFPVDESAIIQGSETIKVDKVNIKYLEYCPNTDGSIIIHSDVSDTTLRCNKFRRDCVTESIGVKSLTHSVVDAELNWWGSPDGPNGGLMDDGKTANGLGVKVIGDFVDVEPWIGIHAEIAEPTGTIEIAPGELVTFDASGSFAYSFGDCCEQTLLHMQYLWDFDDGMLSANKVATHQFNAPGSYEVSLQVDAPGIPGLYSNFMYDWDYVTVHVVEPGTPLTVNADGENLGGYETMVGEPVQLYGDAYGGEDTYYWSWSFGDGSQSSKQNPTHVYDTAGTFTVELTVTSGGESASDTADVIVYDIDELRVNLADGSAVAGSETYFAASVTGGEKPYTYLWDFGDGQKSTDSQPSHMYISAGEYIVTVTITDSDGMSATATAVMNVDEVVDIEPVEINSVSGGLFLSAEISSGSNPVEWSITVDGSVFFGGSDTGDLPAGVTETIKAPLTIGFGLVDITVSANEVTKEYSAFLLGPFFLNIQEK